MLRNQRIKVRVVRDKNKFRFMLPAWRIQKVGARINDFIKITLEKDNHVSTFYSTIPPLPKSRSNLQVKRNVPKNFVEQTQLKEGELIGIEVSLINNKRSSHLIKNNYFDILALIPEKTTKGELIMVELFDKGWCKVWCCSGQGGKIKVITLKRFIKIDQTLGKFFGLMQAESNKTGGKFGFTNNFTSEVKLFIKVSERFGIQDKDWKFVLFHNPKLTPREITNPLKIFKEEFRIKHQTVSVIKNKNLINFTYNCHINSKLLNEIMNTSLIRLRSLLANSVDKELKEFAKGFILKDLLGDGNVSYIKKAKSLQVIISEQDEKSQIDMAKILNNYFNIKTNIRGIKIHLSTDLKSCLWLVKEDAFKEHKKNRVRLLIYLLNNQVPKNVYNRLSFSRSFTEKDFINKNRLNVKAARKYLTDGIKRNFIEKTGDDCKFIVTKKAKEIINTYQRSIDELAFHNT